MIDAKVFLLELQNAYGWEVMCREHTCRRCKTWSVASKAVMMSCTVCHQAMDIGEPVLPATIFRYILADETKRGRITKVGAARIAERLKRLGWSIDEPNSSIEIWKAAKAAHTTDATK